MKKLKLKKWVKIIISIVIIVLIGIAMKKVVDKNNDMLNECDNAKGYTCSYYEARLYAIRGE